ncbi:unnamed protein product, partial [Discosporangium mesarthrocarpum]
MYSVGVHSKSDEGMHYSGAAKLERPISVRRDVECFFGRFKSHWRILKLPLHFHTREDIDEILTTCCIL